MATRKLYNIAIGGNTYEIPSASASQKGLMSSSDFSKLSGIAEGSQANVIEGVKVNGTALALTQKIADILIKEGSVNGTISVNSVDVAVKGLAALAYKTEISKDELAATLKAELENKLNSDAEEYTTLKSQVSNLVSGDNSVDKKIEDAFKTFTEVVTGDNDTVDTFKELVTWVATHGVEAANMATAISTLENYLDGIGGESEPATVIAAINTAIDACNLSQYATNSYVNDELNKKVNKTEGFSLMSDSWKSGIDTKLSEIADGANKTVYSYNEATSTLSFSGIEEA